MKKTLAYTISGWNRRRKWKLFLECMKPTQNTKILDVGFNNVEYSETDNFIEKNYPHLTHVTALGIGESELFKKKYPEVSTVVYDGKVFPFGDKKFDLCWSNAVIEHVGTREDQKFFLSEINRVARTFFITTPNKFFPFEVHTRVPLLHILLPKKWFDRILKMIGKGWATGNYMRLLSYRDIKALLKEVGIVEYKIIRNRFCGFTLDFVIMVTPK